MTVLKSSEIELNSKRFKINGLVHPSLASVWPEKLVVGDYTKADELVASSWIISDQRGGSLIEEMEEDIHRDRFYWSTCNTDYKGHIILPPLATEAPAPGTITHPTSSTDTESAWTDDAKAYNDDITDYAYDDVAFGDNWGEYLELNHTGVSACVAIAVYVGKEDSLINKVDIDVYYDSAWHNFYEDDFTDKTWIAGTLGASKTVTSIRVRFYNDSGTTDYEGRVYDTMFLSSGAASAFANFNGDLYVASGRVVSKLAAAGDIFDYVNLFDDSILDLVPSLGVLFVLLGAETADTRLAEALDDSETGVDVDSNTGFSTNDHIRVDTEVMKATNVSTTTFTVVRAQWGTTAATHDINARVLEARKSYYMDVDETFTLCNVVNAKLGVNWDDKFFYIDKLNQLAYLTTPTSSSTGSGKIKNLADDATKSLFIYRDASGDPIIYAGTTYGLWAHDYTNSKWIQTELSLPEHPTCSAGAAWWRDALYLSAGLNVYEYIAGTIAYIASMGLDSEDGLPTKYVGEIAKFIRGYDNFYGLIDASLTSGTGYSSVFAYNGGAWRCRWVDETADQAMHSGIISSEYAYRFWWDAGSKIYYIPLERSLRNPLKITTSTYATSSIHITPRFDAATPWNKAALRLKAICDKMDAGNEEIIVKYRINEKCYEGIDTADTWTTLVTLDTDGETSTDFASSVGVLFKVIQFRFDLSRGSTTTKTPDLQRVTLVYERTTPAAWAWGIEIDLTQPYRGQTPEQMWENLKAIITGGVLVPFTFTHQDGTAETHYVEIRGLEGTASTGEEKVGTYQLRLVAP